MGRPRSNAALNLCCLSVILLSFNPSLPVIAFSPGDHQSNITVSITVSITTSGTNTAGETYSLVCSVSTVTGSTDQPTITWLDPMNNPVPPDTTGSMSTLTFNPLAASHAGTYTCRATVESAVYTATEVVTVQGKCRVTVAGNVMQTDTIVVSVESE